LAWRILFPRSDGGPGGGEIKVRDYFDHCLAHPGIEPYLYAHAEPSALWWEIWSGIAPERVISSIDLGQYDAVFIGGINWELIPDAPAVRVLNLIQGVRHANPAYPQLFGALKRFAHRICVSVQVRDAIAPYANGPMVLIRNGIPLERCLPRAPRAVGSALILASKRREFGAALGEVLARRGIAAEVVLEWIQRQHLFARLAAADVFVGLPYRQEGFYLPALEAMANGCAVVCADAVGNRDFCIPERTCLQPSRADLDGHVEAVVTLLNDPALSGRIRSAGIALAQGYALEEERKAFHRFLDGFLRPIERPDEAG